MTIKECEARVRWRGLEHYAGEVKGLAAGCDITEWPDKGETGSELVLVS